VAAHTALEQTVGRLHGYLRTIEQRHPRVWQEIAQGREQCKADGSCLASCYVPLSSVLEIANRDWRMTAAQFSEVAVVAGLASWRLTKGLYQYDSTLLRALWDTPIDSGGDLPREVFYRLPEWCVYITTPGYALVDGTPLVGFFAHLDCEPGHELVQLRVLLDTNTPGRNLISLGLHLTHRELSRCIDAFFKVAEEQAAWCREGKRLLDELDILRTISEGVLPSILSLLAYLAIAVQTHEVRDARGTDRLPSRPREVRVKRGIRIFAAEQPSVWSVGYRIGPALRAAAEQATAHAAMRAGHTVDDRRSPQGHIRRAHWHTYWTGPRKEPERQQPVVKWLPPLPINLELGAEALLTTVYPVQAPL
jgi:hypothetical protein